MEIMIKTTDGRECTVKVIKSFYYTIAGNRIKFHIHESLCMLGCYTITHAKSGMRVREFPEYGHGYYGRNFADVAKEALKELIGRVGEKKVNEVLMKAG